MSRALIAAGLLAVSCGPSAPAPREYPRLDDESAGDEQQQVPEREPLRAEPRVIVQRSESAVVTFRVAFDAGSASDTPGREGLTLLTARTMAEGGAGDLSFAELSARLYPMAASIGARVSRDQTVFVGQVHRDHVDEFYELFRDVLVRPRMAEEDFERVRDQTRTSLTIDLRSADDEELGKQALQVMLYTGHPFQHPSLGTERGLARIRIDDVRAQRHRVFCAGRMTLGIAGDVSEEIVVRARRDFARLTSDACVGRQLLPAPSISDAPRVLIVDKPSASATAVSMGMPIDVTREHRDYPALVLAAAWLGQHRQFIGSLMQAIRGRRGLNYGDYAYIEHFTQEGWSRFPLPNDARRQQYFSIWLRPLRPETAHFAIRLAVRELRRLVAEGLTDAQFEHVRNFADRYFSLYFQTASRRLGFAMDDAFYGVDQAYLERLREAWRALTARQLNLAIARHIRPERLSIAIVASEAEGLAAAIASEAESPITYQASVPESVAAEDREIVSYRLGIPRARIRIVPLARMFAE